MKFFQIVAFLALYMAACSQTVATNSRVPAAACAGSGLALDAQKVNFNDDLLPVINKYCVVCHANYATASGLNTSSTLDQAVKAMTNGTMPTDGRRVPAAQIQLFTAWGQAGFPATATAATTTPTTTTNAAGSTVAATTTTNAAGTAAAAVKPITPAASTSAPAATCVAANKTGT